MPGPPMSIRGTSGALRNAVNFGGGSTVTLVLPKAVKPKLPADPVDPAAPTAVPSWVPILSDTSTPAGTSLPGFGIASATSVLGLALLVRRASRRT